MSIHSLHKMTTLRFRVAFIKWNVVGLTQVGLLNKQAQGQLKVEELQRKSEVLVASTSPAGKETIRNEVRALQESFDVFFKDVQSQKDQLTRMMVQWRDYKV